MLEEQLSCKDEVLYKVGEPVDGMYLIKEGEVKYLNRSDYFKPEFVTTKSWCRPNLLSRDNEQAKR